MKHCSKCGVFVAGNRSLCPLCQSPLTGEWDGEAPDFPSLPSGFPRRALALRILAFLTFASLAICAAVNFSIPSMAGGCSMCGWACQRMDSPAALSQENEDAAEKSDLPDRSRGAALCVVGSCHRLAPLVARSGPPYCFSRLHGIDAGDRRNSADSARGLPAVFRGIHSAGLVPAVLLLCGVIHLPLPSLICGSAAVVFLAGLVMFFWGRFGRRSAEDFIYKEENFPRSLANPCLNGKRFPTMCKKSVIFHNNYKV